MASGYSIFQQVYSAIHFPFTFEWISVEREIILLYRNNCLVFYDRHVTENHKL